MEEQTGLLLGEEETPEFAQLEPGRTLVRARPARCCSWALPAQLITWVLSCCIEEDSQGLVCRVNSEPYDSSGTAQSSQSLFSQKIPEGEKQERIWSLGLSLG